MNFNDIIKKHGEDLRNAIEKKFSEGHKISVDKSIEGLESSTIENAFKNKKENPELSGDQAIEMVFEDITYTDRFMGDPLDLDKANEKVEAFVIEWINENTEFHIDPDYPEDSLGDEGVDELDEFVYDNMKCSYDWSEVRDGIKKVEQAAIYVTPHRELADAYESLTKYSDYLCPSYLTLEGMNRAEQEYSEERPDMINWLVQTQGYDFSDLYDEKKVQNSKFLSSLRSEIEDWKGELTGTLAIAAIGADKSDISGLLDGKNIKVLAGKNGYIGFVDKFEGSCTGLEIKLEKDIVVPREWCHPEIFVKSDEVSDYSLQGIAGRINSDQGLFVATDEEPIKVQEPNFDRLHEIALLREQQRERLEEIAESINEDRTQPYTARVIGNDLPPVLEITCTKNENDMLEMYRISKNLLEDELVPKVKVQEMNGIEIENDGRNIEITSSKWIQPENMKTLVDISSYETTPIRIEENQNKVNLTVFEDNINLELGKQKGKIDAEKYIGRYKDIANGKLSIDGDEIFENGQKIEKKEKDAAQKENSRNL